MLTLSPGWIVVSGAAGALGGAIANHFARCGRKVLALDQKVCAGEAIVTRVADLVQPDAVRAALAVVPESEPITLLVNAVGRIWNEPVVSLKGGSFAGHDAAALRHVLDANLIAPFVVATAIAGRMARSGGGAIVNFSSIAATGNPGQAAYSAAKAGIEGMTRAMAAELGGLNIRVNALAPGFVDVTTTRGAVRDKQLSQYEKCTPLGRLGSIADLISAIEFLEENTFVTGQVLKIDGGLRL